MADFDSSESRKPEPVGRGDIWLDALPTCLIVERICDLVVWDLMFASQSDRSCDRKSAFVECVCHASMHIDNLPTCTPLGNG